MNYLFFALLMVATFLPISARACTLSSVVECVNEMEMSSLICGRILTGVLGEESTCQGTSYINQDKSVFLEIDQFEEMHGGYISTTIRLVGPSTELSRAFGSSVYESYLLDLLLFRNFESQDAFAVVSRENRYLKGRKSLAFDLENPNWVLFEASDGGQSLEQLFRKMRKWICIKGC
ncbi:MAG: hypothetical protein WA790_02605 [Sulfitobacter sp.]